MEAPGPTFAALLYVGTTVAMGVLACYGVPATPQAVGALVFLAAFPLLWQVERRAVRVQRLLQKAVKKALSVAGCAAENEGKLVLVCGGLNLPSEERLVLPHWGVEAPPMTAAVRVQVEAFRPLSRFSPQRLLFRRGFWREDAHVMASAEAKATGARVGEFGVPAEALDRIDAWESFAPAETERLQQVLAGAEGGISHMLRFKDPLPFPGECPQIVDGGKVLYYQRAGRVANPAIGDIRVRFLRLPCSPDFPFTAAGVQRGDKLEVFRYRDAPPKGLSAGRMDTEDFNVDLPEYRKVPAGSSEETSAEDDLEASVGREPEPASSDSKTGLLQVEAPEEHQEAKAEPAGFGMRVWLFMSALSAALEGWRRLLHATAPEELPSVLRGRHGRCSYVLHAYWQEVRLRWRLRVLGFSLMVAGLEIAFWKWEVALAFIGCPAGYALWMIALIGSGGFSACTVAVASAYYQPFSALLCLSSAVALFSVVFGTTPLLIAMGVVAACMAVLSALIMLNLLIPC